MCTRSMSEGIDEGSHHALGGDHGVAADVVGDTEPREFQDQAPELLGRRWAGFPGSCASPSPPWPRAVQKQQRRSITGVVVPQHAGGRLDLALSSSSVMATNLRVPARRLPAVPHRGTRSGVARGLDSVTAGRACGDGRPESDQNVVTNTRDCLILRHRIFRGGAIRC